MKQLHYKILGLFLIASCSVFSQKKMVYKNSFEAKEVSFLELDLKNIPLQITTSLDDTIHAVFSMEFENYSENEFKTEIKKLKVNFKKEGKKIILSVKSKTVISERTYSYNSDSGFVINHDFGGEKQKQKTQKRKSKKEIVNLIRAAEITKVGSLMAGIIKQVKNDKKAKIKKASFVLKVPKHLILSIQAEESRIVLEHEETTNLSLNLSDGSFQGRKMINSKIVVKDGSLKIEKVEGGNIKLKNVSKSLIGSATYTYIEAESSKIEIGEIQKNVKIQDFNSEFFLYNFSSDFEQFDLAGEYSKIHFYEPTDDYGMNAVGHDTTFHFGNSTVISQPSKSNKKSKMMDRKPKTKDPSGNINFNIVHSIFYYPTSIKINKEIP